MPTRNPSPSQVREALKNWGSSDVMSAYSVAVKSAATFFTDRYRDCDKCEGTGIDGSTYIAATWQAPSEAEPCPSCLGGGVVPTDESVEAAASAIAAFDKLVEVDWEVRGEARAALIALYMMEK